MKVEKSASAIGAFISDFDIRVVADSEDVQKTLNTLLTEYGVLFFQEQPVSPQELLGFARCFGKVQDHPAYSTVNGVPEVQILESTKEAPNKIEHWHSDMSFRKKPPIITILHAQVIPASGGDTLWASTEAAYASLDEDMKLKLEGLSALHEFEHGFRESLSEPGGRKRLAEALAENPPVVHPVIKRHPISGKKSVYVNRLFTSKILGLDKEQSAILLENLFEKIMSDELTVRFSWKVNCIAMWDNRNTQHKPINDYFPEHRKMHRITLVE